MVFYLFLTALILIFSGIVSKLFLKEYDNVFKKINEKEIKETLRQFNRSEEEFKLIHFPGYILYHNLSVLAIRIGLIFLLISLVIKTIDLVNSL